MRVLLLSLVGCSGPVGDVVVTAWGEEAATVGYTASQTDGWDIDLDHFVSAVGRVALADRRREREVASIDGPWVIDWTRWASPAGLGRLEAQAERFHVGFDLVIPDPGSEAMGQVDDSVIEEMMAQGWAHHVAGTATDGVRVIHFAWGFDSPTRHTECENGEDRTQGIAVPVGGEARLQVTMHVDHLFWRTLGTEESPLAFQGIADADEDDDGEVTVDELRARSVAEAGYETSGVNVQDLYAFIRYSLARAAHLNGAGLCRVQAL
jgi:hypothetical protein